MVYDISVGNFLILGQSTGSLWKVETLSDYIPLVSTARSNLLPENIVHQLHLNQTANPHKNVIVQDIEHSIQLSQLTHPRSQYFNVLHTIPLSFDIDLPPYGPLVSSLSIEQLVSFYVATPAFSTIALTQFVTATVVRLLIVEHNLNLMSSSTIFLQDKRWIPNRGDFIPPNAEFIWDVNLRSFVKIPNPIEFNPDTGYYEGTNEEAFFVQSNGFVLWP